MADQDGTAAAEPGRRASRLRSPLGDSRLINPRRVSACIADAHEFIALRQSEIYIGTSKVYDG